MRTEKEIMERIDVVDKFFTDLLHDKYADEVPNKTFADLYSKAWEEEVALYWALGMERKDALVLVCGKFIEMRMYDELNKQ